MQWTNGEHIIQSANMSSVSWAAYIAYIKSYLWHTDEVHLLWLLTHSEQIHLYPMLGAGSRFWLANNCEVYTRISRLTALAWHTMRKERHWLCHNGDHDRRPLSLPLPCDRATLCLYDDLGQITGVSEILKLWKRFSIWQTSLHHVCFRGYGNLSTLSIAIPR